jgi:hypothetical protein
MMQTLKTHIIVHDVISQAVVVVVGVLLMITEENTNELLRIEKDDTVEISNLKIKIIFHLAIFFGFCWLSQSVIDVLITSTSCACPSADGYRVSQWVMSFPFGGEVEEVEFRPSLLHSITSIIPKNRETVDYRYSYR